jgi:hypothetical protein
MFGKRLLQVGAVGAFILAATMARASNGVLASDVDTSVDALKVYALGAAGDIQLFANDGAGTPFAYSQVTGGAGSLAPSAPSIASGSPVLSYVNTIYDGNEIFYVTPTAAGLHLEQLWGKAYSPTDLSAASSAEPAAAGTGLVGFIDSVAGTDNVFYLGTDADVHELLWSPGAPWRSANVSAQVNPAAPLSGATALSGHIETACGAARQSQEVFYIGADRHVHELWRWSQSFDGWHETDLSTAAGAPLASSASPLASFGDPYAAADVVFYLGADGHIHELVFTCSTSMWSTTDITNESALPSTTNAAFAAHENTIGASRELFYVGEDSAVHELWAWSKSFDGWHPTDVSVTAGAPNAGAGTSIAIDVDPFGTATDEVYYVDTNAHLHQLYFAASGWQAVDVTAKTAAPISIP